MHTTLYTLMIINMSINDFILLGIEKYLNKLNWNTSFTLRQPLNWEKVFWSLNSKWQNSFSCEKKGWELSIESQIYFWLSHFIFTRIHFYTYQYLKGISQTLTPTMIRFSRNVSDKISTQTRNVKWKRKSWYNLGMWTWTWWANIHKDKEHSPTLDAPRVRTQVTLLPLPQGLDLLTLSLSCSPSPTLSTPFSLTVYLKQHENSMNEKASQWPRVWYLLTCSHSRSHMELT